MTSTTTLYDHLGRPIERQVLTKELAAPTLTGIRTVWDESVASGLTPARLAALLKNAVLGDAHEYLTLAEEMEERDLHYGCELGKRKLAVSRLPIVVEAFSDSANDTMLADEVRSLTAKPGFRGLLKDLLDGLGKGYSAVEIIWSRGAKWQPASYAWRDPRFFQFDQVARTELRLRDETDLMNGLPLAPYKYIVHRPHIKSGLPIRGGLARLAAWAWMCKNYAVKDWMAFAEVFGMPLRIGKYQSGALPDDIAVLKMAVANLGSDAAAVIPESMLIELVERKAAGGENTFQVLADWFDAQVSRGILGQTATTQGTPGKLGGDEAQSEVRQDIRDDDAGQLAETISRDLLRPYIDLNFGVQENYPQFSLAEIEPEDVVAISESLAKLVPLGLKVEQSVVRDRLGWPDPSPNAKPEDLLSGSSAPATPLYPPLRGALPLGEGRGEGSVPNGADKLPAKATNREQIAAREFTPEQQALEDLAAQALPLAVETLVANELALLDAVARANSYEEAMGNILDLYPSLDMSGLEDLFARVMLAAELHGRSTAHMGM